MPDPLLDKKNRPDFKCAAAEKVAPHIELVRDLFGGTPAMRKAGEKYLFKQTGEPTLDYNKRLARTVLFEAYPTTVEALVGMVFREEIEIQDDVPAIIKTYLEDIDLEGHHIDVFGKRHFKDQFEGCSVILVEYPPQLEVSSQTLSPTPTALDDKVLNRRPYCVKYSHGQVINWRKERVNGVNQLTLITFEECSTEPDGLYGEKQIERYRTFRRDVIDSGLDGAGRQTRPPVFGPPTWELNRKIPNAKPDESQFAREGGGVITNKNGQPLSRIPVWEAGELGAQPPLLGLAYLNTYHWQSSSDQANILNITRCPQAIRIGFQPEHRDPADKDGAVVGVTGIWDFPIGGDAKYMEITDNGATKAGREDLLATQQQMGMVGLSTLTQRRGSNVTATEKSIDDEEKHSMLATMARSEKDCLEGVLSSMAEYMGLPSGGSIELGVTEERLTLTPAEFQTLLTGVIAGKFPLLAWLTAAMSRLQSVGMVDEDVTVDDWAKQIDKATTTQQAMQLPGIANKNLAAMPPMVQKMFSAVSGNGNA